MIQIFVCLLLLISAMGCGRATPPNLEPPPFNTNSNDNTPELSPTSPQVIYATGWSQLIITANLAKTTIGNGAHFSTTRNACGKDAYGAISLDDWNHISNSTNLAVHQPPSGLADNETYCVPVPDDNIYLNRSGLLVEVKINDTTQTLLELKGDQICSTIQDHGVSDILLQAINNVIATADKEDCPNGWGS